MSLTSTVPPDVPSLFHSSRPLVALLAAKYSVFAILTRLSGDEPSVTVRLMSAMSAGAAASRLRRSRASIQSARGLECATPQTETRRRSLPGLIDYLALNRQG